MGLLSKVEKLARLLTGTVRIDSAHGSKPKARTRRFEAMEPRQMLNGASVVPLHIGATYVETDTGADHIGDTFEITFVGGGVNTQLHRVFISGDKDFDLQAYLQAEANGQAPTASPLAGLDVFFDTIESGQTPDNNGYGADHASPFTIDTVRSSGTFGVSAKVVDGTSLIILEFVGFDAGEKLVFSIDVDQVLDLHADPNDQNAGIDPVTSGVEFQGSTLYAEFKAPNYQDITGSAKFMNAYDPLLAGKGLDLVADNFDGQRDRSAGTAFTLTQTPKPISISGTVFHDRDMDLVRDLGPGTDEHGIDGVTLALWKKNDAGVWEFTGHTTVTANGGKYEFGENLGLMPGTYQVREGDVTGYFDVGAIPGTVAGSGVGSADGKNVLTEITIPLGAMHGVNYDFAEAKLAQVSGYVYYDVDNDGLYEPGTGEIGLGGIRMLIQPIDWPLPGQGVPPVPPNYGPGGGQVTAIVTTNPDGSYTFTGMRPGTYRIIQLDQHPDYSDGKETAGTVDGVGSGVAINPLDPGRIDNIVLASGSTGVQYNFGEIIIPAEIYGRVQYTTRDGDCFSETEIQQGIAGVKIELYNEAGQLVATTFTDANGDYNFKGLAPGVYSIREYTPDYLNDGGQRAGSVNGATNGAVTGTDQTKGYDEVSGIRLKSGQVGINYDFCEHEKITVSGYVYHDVDNDGIKETGEAGIGEVVVQLWHRVTDANGVTTEVLVATTTTNASGFYQFTNAPFSLNKDGVTQQLIIKELHPTGWIDGKDRAGTVGGVTVGSNDADGANNDRLHVIQLGYGDDGINYNFGELKPASISGYVYHDRDNDGNREAGEEGLANSVIHIIPISTVSPQGIVTVTTDANGYYEALGLAPGQYRVVQMVQPPGGFVDGLDTAGFVMVDVGGVMTAQYRGTAVNPGDNIETITLHQNDAGKEYNFGEYKKGSISGRVLQTDANGNCVFDYQGDASTVTHESGGPLAGVKIELYKGDPIPANLVATAYTDQWGRYSFGDLDPGDYTIVEYTPDHLIDGAEHVGTLGGIKINPDARESVIGDIVLTSGDDGIKYDFCEHPPAQLSGYVYHDRDNDGLKEGGEEGIGGVTVSLYDQNGNFVASTTTNPDGSYLFTGLRKGTYRIVEGNPGAMWKDGKDTPGTITIGGTSTVVGVGVEPDTLREVVLRWGDTGVNYNFGEYLPGKIEGYVHIVTQMGDCDVPPTQTPDRPIAGVTVQLLNEFGVVIRTTITDANGKYSFGDLDPGTYGVHQIQPPGYFHASQEVGYLWENGIPVVGSGTSTAQDVIVGIQVNSNQTLFHYNFCEAPPAMISGYVFQDGATIVVPPLSPVPDIYTIRDGALTVDDTRLPNVMLELRYTSNGAPVMSGDALPGTYGPGPIRVMTDANGYYEFKGLRAGDYTVVQIHPTGFTDFLDTPGTSNGEAVNHPGDEASPTFAGWAASPTSDTIAAIKLTTGAHSQHNNFSEVRIVEIPDIPEEPEAPVNPVINLRPIITPEPLTYTPPLTPQQIPPQLRGGGLVGYTWHLSVVDGGQPREPNSNGNAPTVQFASNRSVNAAWDGQRLNEATWYIGQENPVEFLFGLEGGIPVVGDFNGDGIDDLGVYYKGQWFIDLNGNGVWDEGDMWCRLGTESDKPVVGDWDGDGKDDIGIFGPAWSRDMLAIRHEPGLPDPMNEQFDKPKNLPPIPEEATLGTRALVRTAQGVPRDDLIDHVFFYGQAGDGPVAGDWNGTGITKIGIFRGGTWQLDTDGDGQLTSRDLQFQYGRPGDIPIVGDFNGSGAAQVGVYRNGMWILDTNGNREMDAQDMVFEFGGATDRPVVGDFNGDGVDEIGIYRNTSSSAPRVAKLPQ